MAKVYLVKEADIGDGQEYNFVAPEMIVSGIEKKGDGFGFCDDKFNVRFDSYILEFFKKCIGCNTREGLEKLMFDVDDSSVATLMRMCKRHYLNPFGVLPSRHPDYCLFCFDLKEEILTLANLGNVKPEKFELSEIAQ